MTRRIAFAITIAGLLPVTAQAQSLIGLRIEGPGAVIEDTMTLYTVIAEFDTGWEFDVTLDSYLWVDPGEYADIGVFGDFEAFEVEADVIETIHAFYAFGEDIEMASLDVTILNVPPAGFALDFDGSDDFASIPSAPVLQPCEEFTVEVWVHPDSIGARWSRIVDHFGDNVTGFNLSFQKNDDRRVQLRVKGDVGDARVIDDVPADVYFDHWHHIAGVYSAGGDFMRLYVDGVLKNEISGVGTVNYVDEDLIVGDGFAHDREAFDGLIDEVRIWNAARTTCEIRSHMHRPLNGNEPGLVGYWRFDEAEGQYALDSSPYANHGILGNDDDATGDDADPQWVISQADLNLPPFDPPYWTTPEMVEEVSSGED